MVAGLHVIEAGEGFPTVVLESGIGASSLNWRGIQSELAKTTRAVSYDRAGYGWSVPARSPRVARQIVDELHGMTEAAGLAVPFILVGHSFGGLIVRLYAMRHPERVAGLVLIDPILVGEFYPPNATARKRQRIGIHLCRQGGVLARLGIVRALVWWFTRRQRMPAGPYSGIAEQFVGQVRKMDSSTWPAVRAHWSMPQAYDTMARYLEALPASAAQGAALLPLGDLPLIVLSGGHLASEVRAEHEALAALSTRGEHIVAANSGHWIHLDEPELVVDAVRRIIGTWRGSRNA